METLSRFRDQARKVGAASLPKALLALSALVFAGFPAALAFQAQGQTQPLTWPAMLVCLLIGAVVVIAARWQYLATTTLRLCASTESVSIGSIGILIGIGVALRIVVAALVGASPASDGAAYVGLAQGLIERGEYGSVGARAYWPPGMAFVMVPLLYVMPVAVASLAFGVLTYVLAAWGLLRLGLQLGLERMAILPVLVLTVWPTHLLMAGLPEKELLVIALLPWLLWAIVREAGLLHRLIVSGGLMGFIVLVQPSFQLLPFFAAVCALLLGCTLSQVVRRLLPLLLGAALVVAPWTLRNLSILGEPVLVSTNGGGNLYRANNELATGGYVAVGKIDVEAMPELVANREGKRLALEWAASNPGGFLKLTLARSLLFPGDHSYGAYAAFRADPDRIPRGVYLAFKLLAAGPWLLTWLLIAALAWQQRRVGSTLPLTAWLLLVPWLYLASIHAIFESGSKYHLPTLGCILLLLVLQLRSALSRHSGP